MLKLLAILLSNSINPNIQYTVSSSPTAVPFLDIFVKKDNTHIITDIFHKPTDTKQYLNFYSCHPRHTKLNIPFNLARRVCTIVSEPILRKQRLAELKISLLSRDYPEYLIDKGIKRASILSLDELRTPKDKNTDNNSTIISFVNTYSPNQTDIFKLFTTNKDFLIESDPNLKTVFKDVKFINSRRQGPNLKRILTRARFSDENHTIDGPMVTKCNKSRCMLCNDINITSNFLFHKVNFNFNIKAKMNCDSMNLIYVLTCNGCNEYYIGMTSSLRSRTNNHRSSIKQPMDNSLHVHHHIHQCAKDISKKFVITPFYKMGDDNVTSRLLKEDYFINKYQPLLNH